MIKKEISVCNCDWEFDTSHRLGESKSRLALAMALEGYSLPSSGKYQTYKLPNKLNMTILTNSILNLVTGKTNFQDHSTMIFWILCSKCH